MGRTLSPAHRSGDDCVYDRLAIIRVASSGGRDRGAHGYQDSREHPGLLTWRKSRCKQSVVDLPRYGEPSKHSGRKKKAAIIPESVRGGVNVALGGRDHSIAVCVDARDLRGIGV